jgi:hypothetical protein
MVSRARSLANCGTPLEVWGEALTGAVNRSEGLLRAARWHLRQAYLGQVDLAFLATVAAHLERCETCEKRWIDGEVPYELLTSAVRRRPAGSLLAVIAREQRA